MLCKSISIYVHVYSIANYEHLTEFFIFSISYGYVCNSWNQLRNTYILVSLFEIGYYALHVYIFCETIRGHVEYINMLML